MHVVHAKSGGVVLRFRGEHCSKDGAFRLSKRIEAFWLKRALTVRTWIEHIPGKHNEHGGAMYQVRSDLVNGRPSKKSKTVLRAA